MWWVKKKKKKILLYVRKCDTYEYKAHLNDNHVIYIFVVQYKCHIQIGVFIYLSKFLSLHFWLLSLHCLWVIGLEGIGLTDVICLGMHNKKQSV